MPPISGTELAIILVVALVLALAARTRPVPYRPAVESVRIG